MDFMSIFIIIVLFVLIGYIIKKQKENLDPTYYYKNNDRFTIGNCDAGFYDLKTRETLTNGNWTAMPIGEKLWACGEKCASRSYFTDGTCNCICQPVSSLPTTTQPTTTQPATTQPATTRPTTT